MKISLGATDSTGARYIADADMPLRLCRPPGDPHEEVDVYPHIYGAVNWILDNSFTKASPPSFSTLYIDYSDLLKIESSQRVKKRDGRGCKCITGMWTPDCLIDCRKESESCSNGFQAEALGERERKELAAEAHKAAREVGLRDIMAANESGGVTRDSLQKSNPLAVKVQDFPSPSG